ncbi:hypothetical protein CC78DRAFT_576788 [Lojkania enalia]|uniref:Uncharacterized protein n=1 Tax=Lojkania enalia TaxID=147567 RepID=A0A9P4KGX3_9PLEO|nr:hypothetical protein CC78DRAFT_576788 [Didymosphaeria enalia]
MSFTYFFPSIVNTIDFPRVEALLLTVPPYFHFLNLQLLAFWQNRRTLFPHYNGMYDLRRGPQRQYVHLKRWHEVLCDFFSSLWSILGFSIDSGLGVSYGSSSESEACRRVGPSPCHL